MSKSKKLPDNQITFYQTPDGSMNIEVMYAEENIWLPQKRMAELFGCTPDNISLHLKNIYAESELDEKATAEDFSVVQEEGQNFRIGYISRKITKFLGEWGSRLFLAWFFSLSQFNHAFPFRDRR